MTEQQIEKLNEMLKNHEYVTCATLNMKDEDEGEKICEGSRTTIIEYVRGIVEEDKSTPSQPIDEDMK